MNAKLRTALILLGLFLATWVPRVLSLDTFVTVDERKWLARSGNFYYALAHGDFASTFQREHPGVTVMYAGMAGIIQKFPEYLQRVPGYFGFADQAIEAWLKANTAIAPIDLLAAGRWWVVLAISVVLTLSFFPLRKLLGEALAVLALLFVAWMPMLVALSRQLHPDSLLPSFVFAALAFFLAWLYAGRRWVDLIAAGILMGLAWLTKTPAAFLVPVGLILIVLEWWRLRKSEPQVWKPLLIGYVVWGILASAVFFLLWPSTWVNTISTFVRITHEMEDYMAGHVNPNFYMGQPTDNPGWTFYPVAYIFRITPATVVGLIAAMWAAVRKAAPFDRPVVRRAALGFALFGIVFMLLMTLPAKKFDRYLLPAFPPLEVVSALGWGALALWVGRWWSRRRAGAKAGTQVSAQGAAQSAAPIWGAVVLVALLGLIPLHGLFTALNYPYYITYFNPLVGGSATAPKVLFVGWGEGLEKAAAWLNQQPDADKLKVAGWYFDGPLSYFTKMEPTNAANDASMSWLDNDFVVTYINQYQRELPSEAAVQWYQTQKPAYQYDFAGIPLVRIFDLRGKPLPPFVNLNVGSAADFGGKIRLVAAELDKSVVQPGDEVFAQLYLRSLAPMDVNYNVLVRLVDAQGKEVWREEGWPWGAETSNWPVGQLRPDGHHIKLPASTPPGLYKLVASFYLPATLENLPVTDVKTGAAIDPNVRDVAMISVGNVASAVQPLAQPWQFDQWMALTGAELPATAKAGATLPLVLQWTSTKATDTDYTVFVHVVDESGKVVAQKDGPPQGGFAPTHLWSQGQHFDDRIEVPLPADLPPGKYTVRTGLYTQAGRLPVTRNGQGAGDFAVVGEFEVK